MMKRIVLCGWKPGLRKISLTLLLRHKAGYSLAEAKSITDAVLAHKPAEIELPADDLEAMLAELTDLGVEFVKDNET